MSKKWIRWVMLSVLVLAGVTSVIAIVLNQRVAAAPQPGDEITAANTGQYQVLAWNDLGMHCYNRDFTDLAVLPPYNTLWAQVVKIGNPPQIAILYALRCH